MHITQILPTLNQGGVERGTVELNRHLAARGHRSTVISAGGRLVEQIRQEGGEHVTVDVASKNVLSAPWRACKLRRALSRLGPDVIHARSRVPAWLCRFANRRLAIPFVTTVHGFNSVNTYSAVMTKGDLVICASQAIRDYVLEHYGMDAARIRMVPRGIDLDYFSPAPVDAEFVRRFRRQHGLEGRFVITILGRITPWKGHDTFLEGFAQAARDSDDLTAVVVGEQETGKDDYLAALKDLCLRRGIADRVTWAGAVANVREIYALSDLVVSAASFKPETFGRVAAEALAMDTPVVASAQGGTLDIVNDGENGLLFPPQDAAALADCLGRARHATFTNMREHIAANFSLDLMVNKTLAVYRECCDGASRRIANE